MPEDLQLQRAYPNNNEVIDLIMASGEATPGTTSDLLVKSLKLAAIFPKGEEAVSVRIEPLAEGRNFIFEFEDSTMMYGDFEREVFLLDNGDFRYAALRIYLAQRKFLGDFHDVADPTRLPSHPNSEARLLDMTRAFKQYARHSVWRTIVSRVTNASIVGGPAADIMLKAHRSTVTEWLHYERGTFSFVELLNQEIPGQMERIVEFYLVLRMTSRVFAQFFEDERELTLGETPSRTED